MQQKSDPRVTERESYATSSTETAGSPRVCASGTA
jgi:hypothetical protein